MSFLKSPLQDPNDVYYIPNIRGKIQNYINNIENLGTTGTHILERDNLDPDQNKIFQLGIKGKNGILVFKDTSNVIIDNIGGNTGPIGPIGPTGPIGATGPTGPTGVMNLDAVILGGSDPIDVQIIGNDSFQECSLGTTLYNYITLSSIVSNSIGPYFGKYVFASVSFVLYESVAAVGLYSLSMYFRNETTASYVPNGFILNVNQSSGSESSYTYTTILNPSGNISGDVWKLYFKGTANVTIGVYTTNFYTIN